MNNLSVPKVISSMLNRFISRTLVFKSHVTQIDQIVRKASTIYALSTGLSGKGTAIAVIRISGDATFNGLSLLVGNKSCRKLETNPRKAILSDLNHPGTHELIDKGLVFWFPKPNSYTGEDTAELHVHGSRAVVSLLLRTLGTISDFKPAEEGEFTRRAFINGKLDLIEAEGLASLISSQTDAQRRLAMQALDGNVSKLYTQWRQTVLKSIAHLEAIINFSEDEMIDETILDKVQEEMVQLKESIRKFLKEASRRSELIKGGVNMAIIGLPNVGKSTLLNKLCRRDLSIVSPISGTTRDIVEGYLDIKGWSVRVSDTAGLKDTCIQDPIELEGIRRAKQRAIEADLVLLVVDGSCLLLDSEKTNFTQYIQNFEDVLSSEKQVIYIINKMDLLNESEINRLKSLIPAENSSLVSCKTEQSLDELIEIIGNNISSLCGNVQNEQIFITDRHQTHLKKICEALESSMQYFDHDLALAGFYLRQCVDEISSITGKISTEDILDVIFKDFCIGK